MAESPSSQVVLVSDSTREQAVVRLRDAVVEGRLTLEEFSDRVGSAQSARTERDLATLTDDIPESEPTAPVRSSPVEHRALFSHLVRRGPLVLAAHSSFRSLFGTIDLDLREARVSTPEVELDINNVFGTVTVLVPDGADVRVEGGGFLVSQDLDISNTPLVAGAPLIRIRTSGVGGTLRVRTREPRRLVDRLLAARNR